MKTLTYLTLMFFLTITVDAQYKYHEETQADLNNAINIHLRGGYQFKQADIPQDIVLMLGFRFAAYGINLTPELIYHWDVSQRPQFGLKLSYKVVWLEVGKYVMNYSLGGEVYKGKENNAYWLNGWFVAYHKTLLRQNWFFEADYDNGVRLTLGVTGLIAKLKND